MRKLQTIIIIALIVIIAMPTLAQQKVKDLKFHHMQNYCWMRFAEIVPEVTDRVILPIGQLPVGVRPSGLPYTLSTCDNETPAKDSE